MSSQSYSPVNQPRCSDSMLKLHQGASAIYNQICHRFSKQLQIVLAPASSICQGEGENEKEEDEKEEKEKEENEKEEEGRFGALDATGSFHLHTNGPNGMKATFVYKERLICLDVYHDVFVFSTMVRAALLDRKNRQARMTYFNNTNNTKTKLELQQDSNNVLVRRKDRMNRILRCHLHLRNCLDQLIDAVTEAEDLFRDYHWKQHGKINDANVTSQTKCSRNL
uniref:Uncharacterized protein n=1 Tax=Cyclophora tenuis TaxID=216820 RepID=A0A7S1D6U6_CYCTE|mmetsp:Transcript_25211/g.42946  ORF Transcript_25211/g.42946 Transcript_25211/m.42946 type:complete len:224 (+) Transcript_25211:129-800(+)